MPNAPAPRRPTTMSSFHAPTPPGVEAPSEFERLPIAAACVDDQTGTRRWVPPRLGPAMHNRGPPSG